MSASIFLTLAIHYHQPVGAPVTAFEETYERSCLPFLEALEGHLAP